ncbi:MAG TPA: O-antigen polymerase [Planctomycetota bacterium]
MTVPLPPAPPVRGGVLNPALLFPAIWLGVVLTSAFSGIPFYPYSNGLLFYLAGAVLTFCACSLMTQTAVMKTLPRRSSSLTLSWLPIGPRHASSVYLVCMSVSILFQIVDRWLFVGSDWWTPTGLNIYRTTLTDHEEASHFPAIALLNFFFFSAIPFVITNRHVLSQNAKLAILTLLACYIYLSTARASLFAASLIGLFFYCHYRFRPVLLLLAAGGLYSLFEILGGLVGKASDGEIGSFWLYTLAPSHALDQIVEGYRADWSNTLYSFRPLHRVLSSLGLIYPQPHLWPYYETPYPTNVTTLFGPYVLDYGIAGSLVWTGLFGAFSGFLHGLTRRFPQNSGAAFAGSLNLSILTLGIFYDYYTSSTFVWIGFLLTPVFFGSPALQAPLPLSDTGPSIEVRPVR